MGSWMFKAGRKKSLLKPRKFKMGKMRRMTSRFGSHYRHAAQVCWKIVKKNISKTGLAASVDNYPQVWGRDTVVTFLGATVTRDAEMLEAFRLSLETLESCQDKFGQSPTT